MESINIVDDLKEYLESREENRQLEYLDKVVKYCRCLQKEHIEGDGKISGIYMLAELMLRGPLTQQMFFSIYPAVENYNAPYEIILKDEVENPQKGLE